MSKKEKKKTDSNVIVIGLSFFMILFGLGMWGPKSLFVAPITSALQISRSLYSITDTMRYVATAIVNIFFGTLINKFGAKKLICAGFLAFIGASVLYATTQHFVVFYLGGLLLGVGLSWTSSAIVGYIVNKACKKNKGTIMGLVLAANGIGGAIATQIVTPFINTPNNPFGYRNAYLVMAGIFVVVFLIMLFFFREPISAETGAEEQPKKKARGAGWIGIEYKQAVQKPFFYGACVCIFFTGMVLQGITSIAAAHMQDRGLSLEYISIVLSVASIALSAFKFLNGFMYDRVGLRVTITIDCVAAIGVSVCLYFITASPFGMVLAMIYALLKAIALPLETVMLPIYANDLFGEKSFNKVLGLFVSINQVGYALGAPIINLSYDFLGDYKLALILCGMIMLGVIITLQFVITAAQKVRRKVLKEAEAVQAE
ncbi:MAG: MFS transporter [Clostridia bacterium]|nr:MFS transporter [Clostridia bacterium]